MHLNTIANRVYRDIMLKENRKMDVRTSPVSEISLFKTTGEGGDKI